MAEVVEIKVTGLKELEQKLLGLGPAIATRLGDDSLTAASKPLLATMRRLCPVKTGALRRSITSRKIPSRGSSVLSRVVGFRSPGRFYSHLVEFGTTHSAARPFVRPALDTQHDSAILQMGRRMWLGIEAYCIGNILGTLKEDD